MGKIRASWIPVTLFFPFTPGRLLGAVLSVVLLCHRGTGQGIPRDDYFTLETALASARRQFPSAAPPQYRRVEGLLVDTGIVYARRGARELRLDLIRPAPVPGFRYPALLLIHGGGWRSGDRSMELPLARRLAAAGYISATVEYRLSPESRYPASLCDCRDALRWFRIMADRFAIDTSRIGLVGGSSGGHLAALLGTIQERGECGEATSATPVRVRAVVDFDGPLDLTDPSESGKDTDPTRPSSAKQWLGFAYAEQPELWKRASPAFQVNPGTAPLLVVNSSEVRFRAGRDTMMARMKGLGIDHEVQVIPDSPHPFWLLSPWDDIAFVRAAEFLGRHLHPK